MPHGTSQSGRTRVVVTVVLAVLIGVAGAFLLPVLVHEAKAPVPTTFRAEVNFGVSPDGLPRGAGLRVLARLPGQPALVTTEPMPAKASGKAVVGMILDGIADADWPPPARPQIVGEALAFTGLTAVGGDPDRSGVGLSLAVSGLPGQALTLRIRLTGGPTAPVADGRIQIGLLAQGVVGQERASEASSAADCTTGFARPRAVLAELCQALEKAGWTVATETSGALVVLALPEDAAIGSALLGIAYEGIADPPYLWSIELLP